MVEAARKHERIVQTGTQCRSHKGIQDAIAFLRSGKLGQIYMAKGLCYKPRGSIGHKADSSVPADVDYNIWLGPAPERPFNPNRFHYNWHWFWDYGNGDLGNQGIHQMDLARWGLGKNEFPAPCWPRAADSVIPTTARRPTRFTWASSLRTASFSSRFAGSTRMRKPRSRSATSFMEHRGSWRSPATRAGSRSSGPSSRKGPGGSGGGDHFANFIKAVKARDHKILAADIEEGHLSSAYCHLGNIAYRLGRKLRINPSTESFDGDSEADAMLTREYRAPFVVPAKV